MVIEEDYISEIIQLRICRVALRADGILHIDIKGDELFNLEDCKTLIAAAGEISKGEKFLNLITLGKFTIADHDARALSTSKEGCIYKLADAFVINSLPQKVVANFYMNFHKPYVPTHFFNSQKEAVKWLKKIQSI
jgi:hypothetical protein